MSVGTPGSPALERILIVCTANICRSPYAAYALQARLTRSGISGILVDSAGTAAQPPGRAMAPRISEALTRSNIEHDGFESKPLTRQLVERSTLILTAESAHRAAVVRLEPAALARVFTLRQFARLLQFTQKAEAPGPAEIHGLPALVSSCSAVRGVGQTARGADDDVDDPWGRSRGTYRRTMRTIDSAIETIATNLVAATRADH